MYTPPDFHEDRLPVLHTAIRQARLATLVTLGAEGLEASHLPLLLEAEEGPRGNLYGHLARANPQWRPGIGTVQALAIFTGAEAYVSPSWYATKAKAGKAVPTWNYVAVHAYGELEFIHERERLQSIVSRLTERHEAARPHPWAVEDAPEDFVQALLKGIVGFKLSITRLEGKWKMSQNRPEEDRLGVIRGLRTEGGPAEAAVAELMAAKP